MNRERLKSRRSIQESNGPIKTSQSDQPTVGTKGNVPSEVRVALHGEHFPLRGQIPDLDEAILTRPGKLPPVRTEAGVVDVLKSPPKRRRLLTRCRFPSLDCAVATSR